MIDVDAQINAVRRGVGSRVREPASPGGAVGAVEAVEAVEAKVVTVSQTFPVPPEEVWPALTRADRIARWFLPVSGDLRVGGHYQLEDNAGGRIERCEPPRAFAVTSELGGRTSWVEVTLRPAGDGATEFSLDHITLADDVWATFGPGAIGVGWDLALMGLALHLASGRVVDRAESAAWALSPDGARFMTSSSHSWGAAHAAAGAPLAEADAAVEQVIAAYTGTLEPAPAH